MIKAVFFDVDGTLIDTQTHQIPASTISAIKKLRQNGYKVAIASGRDLWNLSMINDLDTQIFDGFVTINGMCVYDENLACIHAHAIPTVSVEKIISFANHYHMTLVFDTENGHYRINEINTSMHTANQYYHETTPPLRNWNHEDVYKITCFFPKQDERIQLLQDEHVAIIPTPTDTYDIMAKQVSKLSGIHELMQYWNFPKNAFLCFGDHENDIEMIEAAEIGVAVQDPCGSLLLQERADAICPRAKEDGIDMYLREHGFI